MIEYSEQIKILCVDDERNVLRALERFFLDDNFEIVNASSAAEALEALEKSGPFQVVISDYRMPIMNGVEFLKAVYGRWPDTVRLVLSGYADVGAIVAAINEGHIYKFIPKPWNDEDLRVTIQNSLELYLLQKRNRELEFSQSLLANLPAGVVAIAENGVITYCNSAAGKLLKIGSGDNSTDTCLENLITQVRITRYLTTELTISGTLCRVQGSACTLDGSESVLLVFTEA
jgi:two-component system NtrC family sensor kinase